MTDPQLAPAIEPAIEAPATEAPQADPQPAGEFKPFYSELPETWREDITKGMELDEGRQNVLNRYDSFPKLVDAFFNQHDKIREGVKSSDLPENPSDEQLAEYRAAKGIPEAPTDYELTLSDGLVLDEADSKIMDSVFPVAHKYNVPPEVVSEMTDAFMRAREGELANEMEAHTLQQQECVQTMRKQWGNDYQTNVNMIQGMLNKSFPEEMADAVRQMALPDGTMAFNNPVFISAMSNIARQLNPAGFVVPNTANPGQSVQDEITKIERVLSDDPDAYYKDQALQKRYEDLLDAQIQMKGRAA